MATEMSDEVVTDGGGVINLGVGTFCKRGWMTGW